MALSSNDFIGDWVMVIASGLSDVLRVEYRYLLDVEQSLGCFIEFDPVKTSMLGIGLDAYDNPIEPVRFETDLNAVANMVFFQVKISWVDYILCGNCASF